MLIVGAGGLGSPAAAYLAAAGVGRLILADDDEVDLSNLQRQILHTTERVGMAKAQSARIALAAINPEIRIDAVVARLQGRPWTIWWPRPTWCSIAATISPHATM